MANLAQEIDKTIKQIIEIRHTQARANKTSYGDNLLGLMFKNMDGEKVGNMIKCQLSIQDIFNECKAFFLGGFETTSTFIAWTMLLLAEYAEWQEHVRKEIQPNEKCESIFLNLEFIYLYKINKYVQFHVKDFAHVYQLHFPLTICIF
jgi:cytochrome P450